MKFFLTFFSLGGFFFFRFGFVVEGNRIIFAFGFFEIVRIEMGVALKGLVDYF